MVSDQNNPNDENNHSNPTQVPYNHVTDTFWFVILVIVFVILFIFIFQFSWNYTMPHIFGIQPISFIQALLFLVVVRMILPCWPSYSSLKYWSN